MIRRIMEATRRHIITIAASIAALIMVALLAVVAYQRVVVTPSLPMEYTEAVYEADKAVYAPGETLYFTPTLTMGHGGQITGMRTIINVDTHVTARLCDGSPSKKYPIDTNLDRGVYGNVMTGTRGVAIEIEKLPPGRYKVATNIHGYGDQSGQVGHDVYFVVVTPCG